MTGETGAAASNGRFSIFPRTPIHRPMIAGYFKVFRLNAIGKEDDVPAIPSGAGNNQSVEIEKMGRLRDLL